MNVVKKLILCLVAVISVSGLARAGQIVIFEVDRFQSGASDSPTLVFEAPVDEYQTINAKFDVDPELGRAWVDVENADFEFQVSRNIVNRKVNGLSYDSEARKVVYQREGSSIVCAEAKSFLGMTTLDPTGNCPLVVSYEQRTVDDGFRPSTRTFATVTMNPKAAPAEISER